MQAIHEQVNLTYGELALLIGERKRGLARLSVAARTLAERQLCDIAVDICDAAKIRGDDYESFMLKAGFPPGWE